MKKSLFTSILCVKLFFIIPFNLFSSEETNSKTRTLLVNLLKPTTPSITNTQNSSEIWGRVRSRLNLTINPSQPLFQRHIKSYAKHQDYINKVIKNASPYFFYILEEVERRGMPSEIALLPIIESDFNPHTRSYKGALGLWQIMPALGRDHGLKQNSIYDGRKDIYESTKVALDHLEYLHKKFNGNWLLAIAAYNCGEGRLSRAIRQSRYAKRSADFWTLNLPKETSHYVPKLLAFAAIVKSPKRYGVVLPTIANKPVIARIRTAKPINIQHAAKLADVSETQLRKLNPGIKISSMTQGALVVPIHDAHKFEKNDNIKLTALKPLNIKSKPSSQSNKSTKKKSTKSVQNKKVTKKKITKTKLKKKLNKRNSKQRQRSNKRKNTISQIKKQNQITPAGSDIIIINSNK